MTLWVMNISFIKVFKTPYLIQFLQTDPHHLHMNELFARIASQECVKNPLSYYTSFKD